ncbi:hypothetical protein BH18THE2_BH18THE2_12280 [soil metagenome]
MNKRKEKYNTYYAIKYLKQCRATDRGAMISEYGKTTT